MTCVANKIQYPARATASGDDDALVVVVDDGGGELLLLLFEFVVLGEAGLEALVLLLDVLLLALLARARFFFLEADSGDAAVELLLAVALLMREASVVPIFKTGDVPSASACMHF